MVQAAGLADLMPAQEGASAGSAPRAEELARDLEALGPTFVKLGQLLSTRPDLVPPAYTDALKRLQNQVEPFPFEEARAIVEAELGTPVSAAFASFSPQPVAAASIAQVHSATLPGGRAVAVKVQRPGIRDQVLEDLEAMREVARLLEQHTEFGERYGIATVMDEFGKSLLRELDFRHEAMHLATIGGNLREIPEILVPAPVPSHSTARVLTMDFVEGSKVTELSPLARLELDADRLADALFKAYLKQMLRDGIFHADPHPGNVFVSGGRIALIDLGMVARLTPALQDRLLQLLLAVADNRTDDAVKVLLLIAESREDARTAAFRRAVADLVGQHQELSQAEPQVGRAVLMLMKAAADNGIRLPAELAMVGKTLLNLDEVGRALAPRFDPNAAIRRHAADITREQMTRGLSPGSLFSTAVDLKNFVTHLPGRVNRILDQLADNQFRVRVDAIDESALMEGMQKVANRITVGLVLAALIVGAALLMGVDTDFRILGYPGLAILLFLGAAIGGIALVFTILMNDIKAGRKLRSPPRA
ncbi:MAG: AarF/ABC1/UbiB kinase family protein [Betaproteobacteria bacterium]|nr:AarF/ABC1/UbiB kinase family protein [Betaproteobacteria bacterium]